MANGAAPLSLLYPGSKEFLDIWKWVCHINKKHFYSAHTASVVCLSVLFFFREVSFFVPFKPHLRCCVLNLRQSLRTKTPLINMHSLSSTAAQISSHTAHLKTHITWPSMYTVHSGIHFLVVFTSTCGNSFSLRLIRAALDWQKFFSPFLWNHNSVDKVVPPGAWSSRSHPKPTLHCRAGSAAELENCHSLLE